MTQRQTTSFLASEASCGVDAGWYLYIIETERGRLYTGITTDLARRFQQHQSGKGGAKFFRSDPPLRFRYTLPLPDRSAALKQEYRIKQLSRKDKLQLIEKSVAAIESDL